MIMNIKYIFACLLIVTGIIVTAMNIDILLPQSQQLIPSIHTDTATPIEIPKQKPMYSGEILINEPDDITHIASSASSLSHINPLSYRINTNGTMEPISSQQTSEIVQLSTEMGIPVIPSVTNESDPVRTSLLLTSSDKQQSFIQQLISTARSQQLGGFIIHWERINPEHGDDFTAFINNLYQALQKENKILILTLPAKTGKPGDSLYSKTFDFTALSKISDYIRIAAYDYPTNTSTSGPITPMNWFIDVITYAKTSIPLEKLIIVLPTYGYMWINDENVFSTYQDIQDIITNKHITPIRDALSYSLSANFLLNDQQTVVWYEDSVSIQAKMNKAQEMGIYQFSFRYIGKEDPKLWSIL
jgi:spore germination protein